MMYFYHHLKYLDCCKEATFLKWSISSCLSILLQQSSEVIVERNGIQFNIAIVRTKIKQDEKVLIECKGTNVTLRHECPL